MPSKSRKNRRYSPQSRKAPTAPIVNIPTAENPSAPVKIESTTFGTSRAPKAAPVMVPTGGYLLQEIKWIGMVTAIVIVLLIAAYYIFH